MMGQRALAMAGCATKDRREIQGRFGERRVDSFEWNKIAGWVLAALIAVLGLTIVSEMVFEREAPEKPGYAVEGVVEAVAGAPAAAAEKHIAFYLATADTAKGEATLFSNVAALFVLHHP